MTAPVISTLPRGHSRIVTQLGARFLDLATARPVTSGLVAHAWSLRIPSRPVEGVRGPSGTYGFHDLPGLRTLERAHAESLASPPAPAPFLVTVADREGRFLPVLFTVDVPFFRTPTSPPDALAQLPVIDVPLFSAPTRAVSAGYFAVRAELWDREADEPAAFALVRVAVGDRHCMSVSDARGQVLVLCPYPLADQLRIGSPPGSRRAGLLSKQRWPVTVEVFSSPVLPLPPVLPNAQALPEPWTTLPGLRAVLEGQPRARIHRVAGGSGATTWSGEALHGRDLILRTTPHSRLLVSRSASPP